MIEEAGSLQRGPFRYFPVVPGRMEFASSLRRIILETKPRVVAVELPSFAQDAILKAIGRLPEMSVLLYEDSEDPERSVYVPIEPADPFIEAVRTAIECGIEVIFLEPEATDRPHIPGAYPDSFAISRIGLDKYVEQYRLHPQPRTEEMDAHARAMGWKLQGADPFAETLIVVSFNMLDPLLDAMQEPQDQPPSRAIPVEVELLNPHPDCLSEITVEYPMLQERYENWRSVATTADPLDRRQINLDLLREAERWYEKNTGDEIAAWHRRQIARYTRNLASINGELVAGLFDLAVAARSIVDDNYGWEVWDCANRYRWQQITEKPETINLSGEEVWRDTKRIRLRRRLPRPKQMAKRIPVKRRKKEKRQGEWGEEVSGNNICSYPPEDLIIEDYGRFLKHKARTMLSSERTRVYPFTTSLLDGIDLRETIRNWHQGKIFVQEVTRLSGDVGAVIVIFDEDPEDQYTYMTTWLGEHQNESDMAFYSTHPFDHMVGPGIGRAEYGGFLMTLPARRMYDVWGDPDYDFAESKSERLLMAGLDYAVERHVVYVAAKPPRTIFRTIAARLGRTIIYIPIGQLSAAKLKRVRVVHVLDGYERRQNAKDFIW